MEELNDSPEQILEKYVLGELTPEAMVSFRNHMKDNSAILEMLDAHDQAEHFLKTDGWLHTDDVQRIKEKQKSFQSKDVEHFSKNLRAVMEEQPSSKLRILKSSWFYSGVAAAVALLIALSVFMNKSPQQLYESYDSWEDLPSVGIKAAASESEAMQMEQAFKNKNYKDVVLKTDLMIANGEVSSHVFLHRGVAFLELEQYDKALTAFNALIKSDLVDDHMGYWYVALVHLKKGEKDMAIEVLEQILADPNNFNYKKASQLKSSIE